MDVVQEGRSSKLRVSWTDRLIVPTCNNSKHLAYMSVLKISRNTGARTERGLWIPEFDPPRSTSRLVKDGAATALFRITHGRGEIVYQFRVATGPECS